MIVDSYHCSRCQHFIGSVEREATPQAAPSASEGPAEAVSSAAVGEGAATADLPAAAPEEVEAASEAPTAQTK